MVSLQASARLTAFVWSMLNTFEEEKESAEYKKAVILKTIDSIEL